MIPLMLTVKKYYKKFYINYLIIQKEQENSLEDT